MLLRRFFKQPHTRVAGVYLVAATLWILFSDGLLLLTGMTPQQLSQISLIKGVGFVFITSAILFWYLRHEFHIRFQLENQLMEQMHQVQNTQYALEASEQRFRRAVEEAPMPSILIAEDGEFLTISRSWLEITGYTADQLYSLDAWISLAYRKEQQRIRKGVDNLFDLPRRVDEGPFTIRCADDSERIWTFSSTPLGKLPDGRGVVMSIAADITQLMKAQEDLLVKDSAIASSLTPFALANLDGELTYVNRAFVSLWGLTGPEEAQGRSILDFWISPVAMQRVLEIIAQQDKYKGELTAKLADGTTADLELTATLVRDADGNPLCMMGSFNDITQRKRAEMFALENERLRGRFQKEQERNALVQRIISALSHDLRTPLAVIQTSKDILQQYIDQISEASRLEKLDTIGRQVQFALELLDDTVNMARGNLDALSFQPTPINVAALCQVSVDEIQSTEGNPHQLNFVNQSEIKVATLDEVLVSRILLNLLTNAIKYSPDNTEVTLELDQQGDWLVLRVHDYGMGISDADLEHIFDPFYRSEDVNRIKGTGLGLSIVKDCVERHQGRITVESVLGRGSTFIVELPLAQQDQLIPAS